LFQETARDQLRSNRDAENTKWENTHILGYLWERSLHCTPRIQDGLHVRWVVLPIHTSLQRLSKLGNTIQDRLPTGVQNVSCEASVYAFAACLRAPQSMKHRIPEVHGI